MIGELKPYAEYRASGLHWLASIPAHWEIARSKRLFVERKQYATPDDLQLSATQAYGVIPQALYEERSGYRVVKISMHLDKRRRVEKDDFVISMRSFEGGLERAWASGGIRSSYVVLKPTAAVHPGYFRYLFKSAPYITALRATANFIRDGQDLNFGNFAAVPLPLLPVEEQAAIARFLDWANGRLERAIRAKRKVIALLAEQKQAIIHRAVTRGLDPSVSLKESGVAGLGNLPTHWAALQVRRVVSFVTSGSRGWASYYSDSGLLFLQSGNLGRRMALNLTRVQYVRPPEGAEGERTQVRQNDILICITGALTGNVVIVDQGLPTAAFVNQHVALARPNPIMVEPRFLAYVLHSEVGRTQFKVTEYGGTKQGLGLDDVKAALVPVPPLVEQRTICEKLDARVVRFDAAASALEREIQLLREHCTRLIADVVTGKLDVHEAAARLPAEAADASAGDDADPSDDAEALDEEAAA